MTLRLSSALLLASGFLPVHCVAAQAADPSPDDAPQAWQGQMQCGVSWTNPADDARRWTFALDSDSTNFRLWVADHARAGDPKPFTGNETRELKPRKAKLEISGLGGGEVEVNSMPAPDGIVWHDITLGHVEKLDALPDRFTLTLAIEGGPPRALEMRDFGAARAYLKRCLADAG
ncbi:hypothetical protein [Sphingopyxis panaciterrae]